MKFRLNGELKLWVENLELEGNDIDDAIRKFISNPQDVLDIMNDSFDLCVDGVDTSSDSVVELYEKEIDVEVFDIEWNFDTMSLEEKQIVLNLPKTFKLEDVTVDNYVKTNWNGYYEHLPITEESEDSCIKESLLEHIVSNYDIVLTSSDIKTLRKEITNEQ